MSYWRTATISASTRAKAALLAAALLAAGCATPGPTLPGASPPASAARPQAATPPAARPPAPRQRPAAPAPKPADNGTQTASRPPAATPTPAPKAGPAPVVAGLTQIQLVRLFGPPREARDAAPAKVLAFRDDTCALTVYLYYDTGRADFVALQYEVDGSPARGPAADACLINLRRDDPN